MNCLLEWQGGFLALRSAVCTAEAVPQTAEPRLGSSYMKQSQGQSRVPKPVFPLHSKHQISKYMPPCNQGLWISLMIYVSVSGIDIIGTNTQPSKLSIYQK